MLISSKLWFCIWFFSQDFCKPLIDLIHHDTFSATHFVDTGRKLNVHKTLRRLPGRLLNVLYTFNLRPVSTGSLSVKSRIWKLAVILCGTYSWTILFFTNNDVTSSFFWHWKISHIKSVNWFGFPIFFLSASAYGMTISLFFFYILLEVFPSIVTINVNVIIRLLVIPDTPTVFAPCDYMVKLPIWNYFDGTWLLLITKDSEMLCFSTILIVR